MPLLGGSSALGLIRSVTAAPVTLGGAVAAVELRVPGSMNLQTQLPVTLVVTSGTLGPMPNVQINRQPDPFEIRRNDRLPPLLVDVYDEFGDPVPLDTATSQVFTMKAADGSLKVNRQAATIVAGTDPAVLNRLQYSWGATDTDTNGRYTAEFELTFAGPLVRTFPASVKTKLEVIVHGDLDAT